MDETSVLLDKIKILKTNKSSDKSDKLRVEHDSFGMPIINGGNFKEIWQAVGYELAKIRLWDIISSLYNLLGRLSELTGQGDVDGDIFILNLRPSNELIDCTIKQLNKKTVSLYENFVKGLNKRIEEVNVNDNILPCEFKALNERFNFKQPVPLINVRDYISTLMILGTTRTIGDATNQLDLLNELALLNTNFGLENGQKIFNDLMPNQPNLNRNYTIIPTDDKDSDFHQVDKCQDTGIIYCHDNLKNLTYICKERLKKIRGICSPGSYGLVVGPNKTGGNTTFLYGGNHDPVNVIPSTYYEYKINSNQAGINMYVRTSNHLPFFFNTINNNVGFLFERSLTNTCSLFIESIEKSYLDRIDTILIRQTGGGFNSLMHPVYRSSTVGIVLDTSGDQMITFRNPNLFEYVNPVELYTRIQFSKSVKNIVKLVRIKYQSSLFPLIISGCDTHGNIFACDLARPLIFPNNIDMRIPQGSFGRTPYYFTTKDTINAPFSVNDEQGYYASWNDALVNKISIPYSGLNGPVPISRGYWINDYISNKKEVDFNDIKHLWQHVARTNALNGDANNLFYNADFFNPIFKCQFLKAIKTKYVSSDIYKLIKSYNGLWLDVNTTNDLIQSRNISDAWILINVWLLRTAYVVMEPYTNKLGIFRAFNPTTNDLYPNVPSVSYLGSLSVFLLARIIGTQKTGSPEFDWLQGRDLNQIINDSLNYTLNILGQRPWGLNKRPITPINIDFINSGGLQFFVDDIPTIPLTDIPFNSSNMPAAVTIAKYDHGLQNLETCLPTGVSGTLFCNPPPITPPNIPPSEILTPHTLDQSTLFWRYTTRSQIPDFI